MIFTTSGSRSVFTFCAESVVHAKCARLPAAAAPGSPAVPAPGPGPAHDAAAPGPEPAGPPRRHHLLWPLLPLLPPGLSSPAGQGGESLS